MVPTSALAPVSEPVGVAQAEQARAEPAQDVPARGGQLDLQP